MMGVKKKTGYVESFDGSKIYYEAIGEGKPLILSYGIACSMNHWNPQIKYFSKHYQVIVYDYRGHHKSDVPSDFANLSVHAIAKDLNALCNELDIKKASFWGHSFGAQVVCEFNQIAPEKMESIVLINGFHKNPIKGMFGIDMVPTFEKLKYFYKEVPKTFQFLWSSLFDSPIATPIVTLTGGFNINLTKRKDIEVYLKGVPAIPMDVFLDLFEDMMEYDATGFLPYISAPTLLIAGDKDNVTPLDFQKTMHELIPDSELQIIPYGSHCSQLDMPDFVNLKIEDFLRDGANKKS